MIKTYTTSNRLEASVILSGLFGISLILVISMIMILHIHPSLEDRQYLCEQEAQHFISQQKIQDVILTECYIHSRMLSFPAIATIRTSHRNIILSCNANPHSENSQCQLNSSSTIP